MPQTDETIPAAASEPGDRPPVLAAVVGVGGTSGNPSASTPMVQEPVDASPSDADPSASEDPDVTANAEETAEAEDAAEPEVAAVDGPRPPASAEAAERSRVDLLLLRRAAGGDGAAFSALVDRHAKPMYRLAYMLTGSAADAEDVLQETWTGVYKALKRFEGRSTVKTWLTRILTTQVALWRRKRRGGVLSLDASPVAQADALPDKGHSASRRSDWQSDLDLALAKLSADHREVIVLREVEGLSYDEIADALKVPRGTVESRLHRARGELRKQLQAYVP